MKSLTTPREEALERAVRDLLPLAAAYVERYYDFVCTHGLEGDLDDCTCAQEALDKMVIEQARKLLA